MIDAFPLRHALSITNEAHILKKKPQGRRGKMKTKEDNTTYFSKFIFMTHNNSMYFKSSCDSTV